MFDELQNNKTPMPILNIEERKSSFEEVERGYSESQAIAESQRCFKCPNPPCVRGCPVGVRIPKFISLIKEGEFAKASSEVYKNNSLPAICGRVCPQENQCEKLCVRKKIKDNEPVAIGYLERFISHPKYRESINNDNNNKVNNSVIKSSINDFKSVKNNKRIAIIGSGPAGLSCARELSLTDGYEVEIFESLHEPGGVLIYGIPEFRLPKSIVKQEIESLVRLGVKINLNVVIGKTLSMKELQENFNAIFISTGAGLPHFLNIPGEMLNGIFSANEFLTRINLMKSYKFPEFDTPINIGKKVVVVGGGNVAIDAARCAIRLNTSQVKIIYRRSIKEMPAREAEIKHALEENVEILEFTAPIKFLGNKSGQVESIECIKTQLVIDKTNKNSDKNKDKNNNKYGVPRYTLSEVENSNHVILADTVIIAIGQSPNPILQNSFKELAVDTNGKIIVDENYMTNISRVFAGGDAIKSQNTVIGAMGDGKQAAHRLIDSFRGLLKN